VIYKISQVQLLYSYQKIAFVRMTRIRILATISKKRIFP